MENYRLGLYEKAMRESLSLKKKLTLAKKSGFDFCEISVDETEEKLSRLAMGLDEKIQLSAFMQRENIFFESMCLSAHRKFPLGSENEKTQARSMQILEDAIKLCRALGISIIQLAGYDVYYEESNERTQKNFENNLKIGVAIAQKHGIILAFETMETPFMNTIEKAMYYVEKIGSPYLAVYPDTGNITNSGVNIEKDIARGKGHIVAAHLKETAPNIFRDRKFGTGHVDFAKAIKAYRAANVSKFLAEMWDNKKDDWQEEILQANVFLRSFLC